MALTVNGTAIPSSGKVIYNGTSLKQVNFGGTKVWNSAVEKQYSIYSTAGRSGWWSSFGNGVLDSGLRYGAGADIFPLYRPDQVHENNHQSVYSDIWFRKCRAGLRLL